MDRDLNYVCHCLMIRSCWCSSIASINLIFYYKKLFPMDAYCSYYLSTSLLSVALFGWWPIPDNKFRTEGPTVFGIPVSQTTPLPKKLQSLNFFLFSWWWVFVNLILLPVQPGWAVLQELMLKSRLPIDMMSQESGEKDDIFNKWSLDCDWVYESL